LFKSASHWSLFIADLLLWICTRVKVEVTNNKTTWVRVKSTGSKTYLSNKYKVSLKNTWSIQLVKVRVLLSVACRGGGGLLQWFDIQKTQNSKRINALYAGTEYAVFHGMVYFPDPVEDIRNPFNK
jgi:hypothetical protein